MIQVPSALSPQQPVMHKQRPRFDLSNLTVNEVEQLESIHRKLFQQPKGLSTNKIELTGIRQNVIEQPSPLPLTEHASSPLNVFQKPQQTSDSLAQQIMSTQSTFNTSALRPEMISELMMIKDIPDLEELTKGMDLSLLSRPGGFALLKEQFIERLIQRTLVQKQMLRRRLRKNHKRRH
ncbi:MAM domain-containing protein [Aphelenchoides bicaudatus]|nr:MAM domain-containing protein [Aphelenchoides bicaudatus]